MNEPRMNGVQVEGPRRDVLGYNMKRLRDFDVHTLQLVVTDQFLFSFHPSSRFSRFAVSNTNCIHEHPYLRETRFKFCNTFLPPDSQKLFTASLQSIIRTYTSKICETSNNETAPQYPVVSGRAYVTIFIDSLHFPRHSSRF